MHLERIYIDNFLSFVAFEWNGIDPHLNYIVGSNGSGKSNLFYALSVAVEALNPHASSADRLRLLRSGAHLGDRERPVTFALDVRFDHEREVALMRAFLAASFADGDQGHYDRAMSLSRFLHRNLHQLDPSPLLAGRLTVRCEPMGSWTTTYDSISSDFDFRWRLEGGPYEGELSNTPDNREYLVRSSDYDVIRLSYEQVNEGIKPAHEKVTVLDRYLKGEGEEPPVPDLTRVLASGPIRPVVSGTGSDQLPTHRELVRLLGLDELKQGRLGGRYLFHELLRRGLVTTANVRAAPSSAIVPGARKTELADLRDGAALPAYLLERKNGDDKDRKEYHDIGKTFHRLTGRRFDVGFQRDEPIESPASMRPELRLIASWGDIPFRYAGAGRGEALYLSVLTTGADGQVVLLDEPAANLHPNMQSMLARELRSHGRAQFFVSTHSPNLLAPESLENVSRFYLRDDVTERLSLARPNAKDRKGLKDWADMQRHLRASISARGLLFSKAVLLVEGETELGAIPIWYPQVVGCSLDEQDIAVHSVGGQPHFPIYLKLLQRFRVPWAVLCDGRAIGSPDEADPKCYIARHMRGAGVAGLSEAYIAELDRKPFAERRDELQCFGVFTVAEAASGELEGFEALPVIRCGRPAAESAVGESKPRVGRYIAENNDCPAELASVLVAVQKHFGRVRL